MRPPRGLHVTFVCTVLVAVGLGALLLRPRPEWKPVRRVALDLDDPRVEVPLATKHAP